jgi:hypothetical protein
LGLWRNWLSQRTHNPQIAGSSPAGPTMEDNMNNKEKLEQMIEVAKQIIKENPDDVWVRKGLVEMEKELERMNRSENR